MEYGTASPATDKRAVLRRGPLLEETVNLELSLLYAVDALTGSSVHATIECPPPDRPTAASFTTRRNYHYGPASAPATLARTRGHVHVHESHHGVGQLDAIAGNYSDIFLPSRSTLIAGVGSKVSLAEGCRISSSASSAIAVTCA